MSLHVIAKIYEGKRIIGYRLLDSKVKISKTSYRYKDCRADEVREQYLKHQWEYRQLNNSLLGIPINDKDKEICGFYRRTDRDSLRTPDGMPLIKDGGKTISNVNTLMEIQPGVYVDYVGCIKLRKDKNKVVNVMSFGDSHNRSARVGRTNLKKYRDTAKANSDEKSGTSVSDELLSLPECQILFTISELTYNQDEYGLRVTEGLIKFLNCVGRQQMQEWKNELKGLANREFIAIEMKQNGKRVSISNVTITERGQNKIDEVKKNLGEKRTRQIVHILKNE